MVGPGREASWSSREVLQHKDFEQMSSDEIARAKAAVARMHLLLARVPTRRYRRHRHGSRIDMRASLRSEVRRSASPGRCTLSGR